MAGLLAKVLVKVSEATKKKEAKLVTLNRRDLRNILKMFYQEGWVDFTISDLEYMFKMSPKTCFKFQCENEIIGATFALKLDNGVCYPNSSIIAEKHRKTVKYHEEVLKYSNYLEEISTYEVMYSAKWLVDLYRDTMGYQDGATIQRYQVSPHDRSPNNDAELVPLDDQSLPKIASYLEGIYNSERTSILKHAIKHGFEGFALEKDGLLTGFVMARQLPKHIHIGPLIGSSDNDAVILLKHILNNVADQHENPNIMIDIPEHKANRLIELNAAVFTKDNTVMVKMTRGDEQFKEREEFIYSIYSHYLS